MSMFFKFKVSFLNIFSKFKEFKQNENLLVRNNFIQNVFNAIIFNLKMNLI